MTIKWTAFALATCLMLPAAALADINLVQNPGFESGTVDWTFAGWDISTQGGLYRPHTGAYSAANGCIGPACLYTNNPTEAFIYQDLSTQIGMLYNLTFWYSPDRGIPNELDVRWNGGIVQAIVNDLGGQTYQQVTIPGLLATASTTRLEFSGRQDPAWMNIDDVNVGAVTGNGGGGPGGGNAVPEPSAIMLLATVVAGLGLGWRRRLARP